MNAPLNQLLGNVSALFWLPLGFKIAETAEIFAAVRPAARDPKSLVISAREGSPLEAWNLLEKQRKATVKKAGGLPGMTRGRLPAVP